MFCKIKTRLVKILIMKIAPINNFKYKKINPSFSSYNTEVRDNNKLVYKTQTDLFRQDLNWRALYNLIAEKYERADKVNIVDHACSAGYEPWSMLIMLKKRAGKDFQKYMPIIARDIDKDAIEYAKQGKLGLCYDECLETRLNYGPAWVDNFDIEKRNRDGNINNRNEYLATCKTDLGKNIDFAQSDIFQDKELINKDNTVLLLRNCWPYFGEDRVAELAYFLADNMKPSSILVIGQYDHTYQIDKLLRNYGFKNTWVEFVYEAPGKSVKNSVEKFPLKRRDEIDFASPFFI